MVDADVDISGQDGVSIRGRAMSVTRRLNAGQLHGKPDFGGSGKNLAALVYLPHNRPAYLSINAATVGEWFKKGQIMDLTQT